MEQKYKLRPSSVQRSPLLDKAGWTSAAALANFFRAPTHLTRDELQNAAQATRIARQQALDDAGKQSNLSVRSIFEVTARRFAELSAKFERARKLPDERQEGDTLPE